MILVDSLFQHNLNDTILNIVHTAKNQYLFYLDLDLFYLKKISRPYNIQKLNSYDLDKLINILVLKKLIYFLKPNQKYLLNLHLSEKYIFWLLCQSKSYNQSHDRSGYDSIFLKIDKFSIYNKNAHDFGNLDL